MFNLVIISKSNILLSTLTSDVSYVKNSKHSNAIKITLICFKSLFSRAPSRQHCLLSQTLAATTFLLQCLGALST
jgi:hypothetical protein